MRALPRIASIAIAAGLALAASGLAAPPAPVSSATAVTCTSPVGPHDSARTLLRRFGRQARIETIAGAEGETARALVIYPRDPRRRLEVLFFDEALRQPSSINIKGRQSDWSIAGFRLGDSLDRFTEINGKPFELAGFEWDYGGIVHNWGKGALEKDERVCMLSARFAPTAMGALPDSIMGDVVVRSDQAAVRRARPVATELSMNWNGGQ